MEVAVGTGKLFAEIVKSNPQGHNEGIDISPEMLTKAKTRLTHSPSTNYDLKLGNVYQLGTFDLIICNYLIDMLPEKDFIPILKSFNLRFRQACRNLTSDLGKTVHRKQAL